MKATYSAKRNAYLAFTRFRDYDGVTRLIKRAGSSKTAALTSLQDELKKRMGAPAQPLRPTDTFERASEMWLRKLDAQVSEGTRQATTADTYRQRLHSVVLPAMGQRRLRECTVPRLDTFFTGLAAVQGPQSRKPRALTAEERRRLLAWMAGSGTPHRAPSTGRATQGAGASPSALNAIDTLLAAGRPAMSA